MSNHALLSPSSAKRWLNCYGSVAACKGKPRLDTEFSLRGTFGHDVAADLLRKDIDYAASAIGRKSADGKIEFDKVLAGAVQHYLDAVRFVAMKTGGDIMVEQRVQLTPTIWGTGDAMIWSNGRRELDIFDLKLGAGVFVDVDSNEQMLVYALAAMAENGIYPGPNAMERVTLHIVQPLYTGAVPHRSYTTSNEELHAFRIRIAGAELEIAEPDAPLVPGEWCKFCPARDTCPAVQAHALEGAKDIFDDMTLLAPVKAPPLLESLAADQLAFILTKVAAMESWIEAVQAHAKARAMAGETVPGFKLVERMGHRKWVDETAAATALQAIGVDPWAPRELISPAQADKKTKAAKEVTAKLAAAAPSGVSLVPLSDRRKALTTLPTTDIFDVLPD